jgi:hypothetical protein
MNHEIPEHEAGMLLTRTAMFTVLVSVIETVERIC